MPCLAWRPDDAVRLFRFMAKPILIAAVVLLLGAALLLGGRSLAPFVIGGAIGNPAQFAMSSPQQAAEERALQAETDRLLATFESSRPSTQTELP